VVIEPVPHLPVHQRGHHPGHDFFRKLLRWSRPLLLGPLLVLLHRHHRILDDVGAVPDEVAQHTFHQGLSLLEPLHGRNSARAMLLE